MPTCACQPCERVVPPCGPRTQRPLSRELRASILYVGCDCEKRNGLQDDCRRTGCQGSAECMSDPPTCVPSEFSNGKHLEKIRARYMKKA